MGGFLIAAFAFFPAAASAQMAAIAAVDEPAEGGGSSVSAGTDGSSPRTGAKSGQGTKAASKRSKPSTTSKVKPSPPPPYSGPVIGDKFSFLNNEVVSAEKPYYTRAAKASGAKGLVQVEVLVSTDGSVLSAKARTGNKELWPEAERAARASKFNRPTADGRPVRAMGFLVYRFGPAED